MLVRFEQVRRTRRGAAFTLMEAVVTLVVLSLVVGLGVLAWTAARKTGRSTAAVPLLGAVQAQTRGLVSAQGYTLPSDQPGAEPGSALAGSLSRSGVDRATFTTGPSNAVATADSTPLSGGYTVSVTTSSDAPGLVGYAVRTSGTSGTGCLVVVDRVSGDADPVVDTTDPVMAHLVKREDLSSASSTWYESDASFPANTANTGCKAVLPPVAAAGAPQTPTCEIAEVTNNGGYAVTVRWTAPTQGPAPDGYKLYRYDGSPSFVDSVTADPSLNWLDTGFSTAQAAAPPAPVNGVDVAFTSEAWEGNRAYQLTIPKGTGQVNLIGVPDANKDATGLAANTPVVFSTWVKRLSSSATEAAVKPRIVWRDALGNRVGTAEGTTTVVGPMYKRVIAATDSVPAGARYVTAELVLDTATITPSGDTVLAVDGFAMETGATPGTSTPVTSAGFPKTVVGAGVTQYVDASVAAGATYTYLVTAYRTVDGQVQESAKSDVLSVQPLPSVVIPVSPVSNLVAVQPADGSDRSQGAKLTWTAPAGSLSQLVYRKATGADDSTYVKIADLAGSATSYLDASVEWNGAYTYRVAPTTGATAAQICGVNVGGDQILEGSGVTAPTVINPNPPILTGKALADQVDAKTWSYPVGVAADRLTADYTRPGSGTGSLQISAGVPPTPNVEPGADRMQTCAPGQPCAYTGDRAEVLTFLQTLTGAAPRPQDGTVVDTSGSTPQVTPGSVIYYQARTVADPNDAASPRSCWSTEVYAEASGCTGWNSVDGRKLVKVSQPLNPPVPQVTSVDAATGRTTVQWAAVPGADSYALYADNTAPGYAGATFQAAYEAMTDEQRSLSAYPAGTAASAPSLTFSGTVPAPAAAVVAGATPAGAAAITSAPSGVLQTAVTTGNPSRQNLVVIAFRSDTGVFSENNMVASDITPQVSGSCSVPASSQTRPIAATLSWDATQAPNATEFRIYAKDGSGWPGAHVSTVPAVSGQTNYSVTENIFKDTSYEVVPYFRYAGSPPSSALIAGNVSAAGLPQPERVFTCATPPLAVNYTTFFAGTDGSGVFSDQYVAIDNSTAAAEGVDYYAVFDAPAYPAADGTMVSPKYPPGPFNEADPGFYLRTPGDGASLAGHYVLVNAAASGRTTDAATQVAPGATASTTPECSGTKLVVGPTGAAPCGRTAEPAVAGGPTSLAAFANRRVFLDAGRYRMYGAYVMALAIMDGESAISYSGGYPSEAAPFVSAPAAPQVTSALSTATTLQTSSETAVIDGTTYNTPRQQFVTVATGTPAWSYVGALDKWAAQPYALSALNERNITQTYNASTQQIVSTTNGTRTLAITGASPSGYASGGTTTGTAATVTNSTTATFQVSYSTLVPNTPPASSGSAITSGFNPDQWAADQTTGQVRRKGETIPAQGGATTRQGLWNNDGRVKAPPSAPNVRMNYTETWTGTCYANTNCSPGGSWAEAQMRPANLNEPLPDFYTVFFRDPGLALTTVADTKALTEAANPPTGTVTKLAVTPGTYGTARSYLYPVNVGGTTGVVVQVADGERIRVAKGSTTVIHAVPQSSATSPVVWGSLTATNALADGRLTLFRANGSGGCAAAPAFSSLAYQAGVTATSFATTSADANGDVCLYSSADTSVLWDQQAATTAVLATGPVASGTSVSPATAGPTLVYDSNFGDGALAAGSERVINLGAGWAGYTVLGSLSVVSSGSRGSTSIYTCGAEPNPNTSVYTPQDANTANGFAVKTDASGRLCVRSGTNISPGTNISRFSVSLAAYAPQQNLTAAAARTSASVAVAANSTALLTAGGATSSTVLGTLVATEGTGWLKVFPAVDGTCSPGSAPAVTNLTLNPASPAAAGVSVRTDSQGRFCVYASGATSVSFDRAAYSQAVTVGAPQRLYDSRAVTDPATSDPSHLSRSAAATSGDAPGSDLTVYKTWVPGQVGNVPTNGGAAPSDSDLDWGAFGASWIIGAENNKHGPYVSMDTFGVSWMRRWVSSPNQLGPYLVNHVQGYCVDLGAAANYNTSYVANSGARGPFMREGGNDRPVNGIIYPDGGRTPSDITNYMASVLAAKGGSTDPAVRHYLSAWVWYQSTAGNMSNQFWNVSYWGVKPVDVYLAWQTYISNDQQVYGVEAGGPYTQHTSVSCPVGGSPCWSAMPVGSSATVTVQQYARDEGGSARAQSQFSQYLFLTPGAGPIPAPVLTNSAGNSGGSASFVVTKQAGANAANMWVTAAQMPSALTIQVPNDYATGGTQRMAVSGLTTPSTVAAMVNGTPTAAAY